MIHVEKQILFSLLERARSYIPGKDEALDIDIHWHLLCIGGLYPERYREMDGEREECRDNIVTIDSDWHLWSGLDVPKYMTNLHSITALTGRLLPDWKICNYRNHEAHPDYQYSSMLFWEDERGRFKGERHAQGASAAYALTCAFLQGIIAATAERRQV